MTNGASAAIALEEYSALSDVFQDDLQSEMKPELLNCINEIIVFSPLDGANLRNIARAMVAKSTRRAIKEKFMVISASEAMIDAIMDDGSMNAAKFGAQPMLRAAQRLFEDAVSGNIVRRFLREGDNATVDVGLDGGASGEPVVVVMSEEDGELL